MIRWNSRSATFIVVGIRLPVPFKTKEPVDKGWQRRIIKEADAPKYFNGTAQNVGIVLGPSSNGLTDVDLDCIEAIAIAPYVLPRTRAIFGRASKPRLTLGIPDYASGDARQGDTQAY